MQRIEQQLQFSQRKMKSFNQTQIAYSLSCCAEHLHISIFSLKIIRNFALFAEMTVANDLYIDISTGMRR